jgi:serine phosphatase RsbU (regulator of sigma subunit)
MFLAGFVNNFLVYEYTLRSQFQQLRKVLMMLAQETSLLVDPETLASIPLNKEGLTSPQYKAVEERLSTVIRITPQIRYVYILKKTQKEGILQFIIDVGAGRKERARAAFPGEGYDASGIPELLEGFNGPSVDKKLEEDKWGVSLSGYAPISDEKRNLLAVLGIDIAADDVRATQQKVRDRALLVLIIGIAFSAFLGVFISGRVADPVQRLSEGTRRIARGDLGYRVEVNGRDEIAQLASSFNRMASDLKEHIEELKRTTSEKERFLKELEIARGIQQSFLPDSTPHLEGFDIAVTSLPAMVVGGDFYDFIPIGKDVWGLAVADVSGKGIAAAIFMALSRTLIRASAVGKLSPLEAIRQANALILEDSRTNMFVTLFYAILDPKNMKLVYVNAGHNPPILMHEEGRDIVLLRAQGIPLGVVKDLGGGTDEISLKRGDVLALYTDGIPDALNGRGEQFGMKRLTEVIGETHRLSVQEITRKVLGELKVFVGGEPQFDDITLMVVKSVA